MTSQVPGDILGATEHLPDGATLVIPQVVWDDYERLLEQLSERPRLRVSYDSGRLEIVSPLADHERYARMFDDLVGAYADAHDLELEKLGQTTWKIEALAKGAEADACYYVRNVERIIGKSRIQLESDPPPDIVVEIDTTKDSRHKFPIYAAFSIPEIWRYDGKDVLISELVDDGYVSIPESRFFPGLTGHLLAECIEVAKTRGRRAALKLFRDHIRPAGTDGGRT